MDALSSGMDLLPWVVGALAVLFALVVLKRPLRRLCALLARTGLGLCALYVLSPIGAFLGVSLGVNVWNALALGALGPSGLGLLLLLNWTFR